MRNLETPANVPRAILEFVQAADRKDWTHLDLGTGVSEVPAFIASAERLQRLHMAGACGSKGEPVQALRLPKEISGLTSLTWVELADYAFETLPPSLLGITNLKTLRIENSYLSTLPPEFGLLDLRSLSLTRGLLAEIPSAVLKQEHLEELVLSDNLLTSIPPEIARLKRLRVLSLRGNAIHNLPVELGWLERLDVLELDPAPLNPALASAYAQGLDALRAYLRSIERRSQSLFEAKLVLVGEGDVGKTTLMKALTGRGPRRDEPTTHGVSIDVHSLYLPHPGADGVDIQFNCWDFGGQEVYRVTHQFFFSRRSIYLLVWEPRMGVLQCQVESWLKLIRLRVGDDARVIIVSTHARTGQRIARIDKPVFLRDFGSMVVDFVEVDSLEQDPATREWFGSARLREAIARAAGELEHMGMLFNVHWRAARDELIAMGRTQPRIGYAQLAAICAPHGLDDIDTRTLAGLMHDLGYIVYYGDDERLSDDVVLQPEWLTKAIGFLLEDRTTQEMDGILPDRRLKEVWLTHPFEGEPRYEPELYPFFLRLMEKYDVSYRLENGDASLVAQHVPQVRPPLPWLPEDRSHDRHRRLAMVCVMDEVPPGLIPWMIVRTHPYAYEVEGAEGVARRLYWQKGMFLRNSRHGEAMLELRDRELHVHVEAVWPEYFMNVLRSTLEKLIADNWLGMANRYRLTVPCRGRRDGAECAGRFPISALKQFLQDGDDTIRCQTCYRRESIVALLYDFEAENPRELLGRIEHKLDLGFSQVQQTLDEFQSRMASYVMTILKAVASESRSGPRLFTLQPAGGNWHRPIGEQFWLTLWCEADGCQHPVYDPSCKGTYKVTIRREWVQRIAPYTNLIARVLKTLVPMVAPAVNVYFGPGTMDESGLKDHLELIKEGTDRLLLEVQPTQTVNDGVLSAAERSGILALHALLREVDPHHEQVGLVRVPTYTGEYLWLCRKHFELSRPAIPETIA